jgi:thiol-disulfide isomerase/thioredoxin
VAAAFAGSPPALRALHAQANQLLPATTAEFRGRLAALRGHPVIVNIWGSWCGPCRAELPGLQQVYDTTKASGVAVLGIDVRDDRSAAADFVRDRAITFPSIFDQPGRSLDALSGYPRNTVPSTIVLDREHRVAAVFLTSVRATELLPVVQRLAAEPRAA